jgi:hypothetical protein
MDSESIEAIRARLLDKESPPAIAAPAVAEASTTALNEKLH